MRLLDKLERPFGWISIGHLPVYVVSAQGLLYLWTLIHPGQEAWLAMDPQAVLAGEWWRLLTFLFLIPFENPLFVLLFLYFQYVCGETLENEWGSFRFTFFYLVGAMGCMVAAFIGGYGLSGAFYLNDTVFLAFAALYPDLQILLLGLIPIRVKWLAWFTWILIALGFKAAPTWGLRLAILISLSNYFLFFSASHVRSLVGFVRRMNHKRRYRDWNE